MTDIIIRTHEPDTTDEPVLVGLQIFTQDEDWADLYNRIQVFRSTQGPGGPFEEITAAHWSGPRLPHGSGDEPSSPVTGAHVTIVGASLALMVQQQVLTVTFTGSDPLNLGQVAAQIEAQGRGLLNSYVDVTGQLVIEVVRGGTDSRLQILSSDGAVILGLPTVSPESIAIGAVIRPTLNPGQTRYTVYDFFGSQSYYYRTRFLNDSTGVQSDPTIAFTAGAGLGVDQSQTIVGFVQLIENSGVAQVGAEVHIYSEFDGTLSAGNAVTGGGVVKKTDSNGRAEFTLIRGQKVSLSIQGTSLYRTITVPTDPSLTYFNLLGPGISDDDIFKAVVPELITAERRTT
jgi:hypothetical protein